MGQPQSQMASGGAPTWNPGQSYYGSDPTRPLLVQNPAAQPYNGYVWTPEGIKTVWETNGYAPPDYEKFVEQGLKQNCVRTRVYPGTGTIEGLFSGLDGLIPRRNQNWRYYGVPLLVPTRLIHLWCPLPHAFPVATIYRGMPSALATHYLLIRDAGPSGTGLPLSGLLGGNQAVLHFLVQKYTPFGPVLHEPYTNGMYMVRADFTVPMKAAFSAISIQDNLVNYDTPGLRESVPFTEIDPSRPMFKIAIRQLAIQYPVQTTSLFSLRYGGRTPDQVEQSTMPASLLNAPALMRTAGEEEESV